MYSKITNFIKLLLQKVIIVSKKNFSNVLNFQKSDTKWKLIIIKKNSILNKLFSKTFNKPTDGLT